MAFIAMPIFMPSAQAATVSKKAEVYTDMIPSTVNSVNDSGISPYQLQILRRIQDKDLRRFLRPRKIRHNHCIVRIP